MSAKSLSEVVYKAIFPPEGAIPLKAKRNIQAIDARIKEIEDLAEGRAVEGMTRRISSRSESQSLTEQIVQLRDSCNPPMSYREIMKRLGHVITPDAARNRYDDYKQKLLNAEAYAAMSGGGPQKTEMPDHIVEADEMIPAGEIAAAAEDGKYKEIDTDLLKKPEQIEEATIRESQTVEEIEEVKPEDATLRNVAAMGLSQKAHILGPKIPHSEDDLIFELRTSGKTFSQIQKILQEKGIECGTSDIAPRYYSLKKKAGSMDVKHPSEKSKLSAIDAAILRMADRDALPSEICIAINRNFNQNLSTGEMAERIRKLRQERS